MAADLTAREMIVYKNALRELAPEAAIADIDEASPWVLESSIALAFVVRLRTIPTATLDDILNDSMVAIGAEVTAANPTERTSAKKTSSRTVRSPSSTAGRSRKSAR